MKEVLKDLCKKSLEKAYEQNLKSLFTSFFYDNNTKDIEYISQCKPDIYMQDLAVAILDSFVSSDFTVSKITCNLLNIEEIEISPLVGNFNEEFIIYNIKEKGLNIAICDIEGLFFFGNENIYDMIKYKFVELCDKNMEQYTRLNRPDIFDALYNADDFLMLDPWGVVYRPDQFNYSPKEERGIANLQYILNYLYGENAKTAAYQKVIEKYLLDLNKIIKMGLEDLYKENNKVFIQTILPIFINKSTQNFNRDEKGKIYQYLANSEDINKIIRLILTFQYTLKLNECVKFNQHIGFSNVSSFLDFSFVAVQMFKLVEIVFYNLLNKFWITNKVVDKYGSVNISDDKINLGKMNQFFKSDDEEIVNHLKLNKIYNDSLQEKLSKWISKTRNGFLHKHILPESLLTESVSDSIDIVCLLILVLMK